MADYQALQDAERLVADAEALLAAIDREIAAMEAAVGGTEEGIEQVSAIGRRAGDHVAWLGDALDAGRDLQIAAVAGGVDSFRHELGLRLRASAATGSVPAGPDRGADAVARHVAHLPEFRRTTRAELAAVELPFRAAHAEAWRRVAEDHPSLGEALELAIVHLEEAAELADSRLAEAERFRRRLAERQAATAAAGEPDRNRRDR